MTEEPSASGEALSAGPPSSVGPPPSAASEDSAQEPAAEGGGPTLPGSPKLEGGGTFEKGGTLETPVRPRKPSLAVTRLIQAVWLGSGVFLMLTAAAAFSAASNSTDAANVAGAVLTRWHYIALFAPLLLMFLEWRRSRPVMLVILFIAVLLASFQALLDTRIRVIRNESFVPISSLAPNDPVRRQFGLLHGMSTLFLVGQVLAAGAAVATRE